MKFNWRSSWMLGVVVLLLLAGYLLQRLEDSQGDSPPEVPDSELTPAVRDGSPNATETSEVRTPTAVIDATVPPALRTQVAETRTPAPPVASLQRRDLGADEAQGGHTLARHVARTDDQLRARLKAEPDISAASTYTNRETAERVVAEVLTKKKSEVDKWEARTGSRPNLVLRLDLREVIGRSIEHGKTNAVEVEDAVVVLRWTGNGWYVLTSYPEER